MSHMHTGKSPPAALTKPPLPGRERIVLRLLVLLALLLVLAAPILPGLADHIPGQSLPPARNGYSRAGPPQRMLAQLLRSLSHPPARDVTTGIVIGSALIVILELVLAARRLVQSQQQRRGMGTHYLRLRPLRPQSRLGAQRDSAPEELWRSLHALESHVRTAPGGAWVALTLSAQPEEPVTLGAVVTTAVPTRTQRQEHTNETKLPPWYGCSKASCWATTLSCWLIRHLTHSSRCSLPAQCWSGKS